MQHDPELKQEAAQMGDGTIAPQAIVPKMVDRSEQRLTNFVGGLFSIASFMCLVAISVLALLYMTIVAQDGEIAMIPIFAALGVSLILGMFLLDFTHAKSLAGYREAREKNARHWRAVGSAILCLLMGMIHPLMAGAIPLATGAGCFGHYLLKRLSRGEAAWDYLPQEAISILSGRDQIGMRMASMRLHEHVMSAAMTRAGTAFSVICALSFGSYLVAQQIMAMAALIPMILGTILASQEILNYAERKFSVADTGLFPAMRVGRIAPTSEHDSMGLRIRGLSLRAADGDFLISDLDIDVDPGQIVGILGSSGAGKTLLLRAISDPFSLANLEVTGSAQLGPTDLWLRQGSEQSLPAVYLPSEPILLPASGADNLTCFHDAELLTTGRWLLERLVFSVEMVERICEANDARNLPSMQRKVLALARAFLLRPSLYLLDRPEDGLPEKQVNALAHRLRQEAKIGRSVMIVTNNRALLDACDRILILQNGRGIDYGEAQEVRGRMDVGWSRFIGDRLPETEEVVANWARSHFLRGGDEGNQRKVATIISDMLAYSCQSADLRNPGQVHFLFKHFQGHCLVRMLDSDPPLSAGTIHKANEEAESSLNLGKMSILGSIMRNCEEVDCGSKQGDREIIAKIKTYDPRKRDAFGNG